MQPSFFFHDHLVDLARGVDLGNDADLLPNLLETGDHPLVTGAILCRQGRYEEACGFFEKAQAADPLMPQALLGWSLLRAGNVKSALEVFEHLKKVAPEPITPEGVDLAGYFQSFKTACAQMASGDADAKAAARQWFATSSVQPPLAIDQVVAAHGLADCQMILGGHDEAQSLYQQIAHQSTWALVDLALLHDALGHDEQMAANVEILLAQNQMMLKMHKTVVCRFAQRLAKKDPNAAASLLDQRGYLTKSQLKEWTTGDYPEFFALPQVVEVLKPDTSWITNTNLRAVAEAIGALSEKDGKAFGGELEKLYQKWDLGILWTDTFFAMCGERAKGLVAIAMDEDSKAYVLANFDQPDEVYILPSFSFPTALMLPAASDPANVEQVLKDTLKRRPLSDAELSKTVRAHIGTVNGIGLPNPYTGNLDAATPLAWSRHLAFSPAVFPLVWGSQHRTVLLEEVPPQPNFSQASTSVVHWLCQQNQGAICSYTWRTRYSKSLITLELHDMALWMANIRYVPSSRPEVVRGVNTTCRTKYPDDLPVDVICFLFGLDWITADEIQAQLDQSRDTPAGLNVYVLFALAALVHTDPVARRNLAELAMASGHEAQRELLRLTMLVPPYAEFLPLLKDVPGEIGDAARQWLNTGIPPLQYDQFGDPVGLADLYPNAG